MLTYGSSVHNLSGPKNIYGCLPCMVAVYNVLLLEVFVINSSCSNNLMFWTDISSDRIWRAQLDNSNPTILVQVNNLQ